MTRAQKIFQRLRDRYPNLDASRIERLSDRAIRLRIGRRRWRQLVLRSPIFHLESGQLVDSEPDLVLSDDDRFDAMVKRTSYRCFLRADGSRRLYPRRDDLTRYIDFSVPQVRVNGAWHEATWSSVSVIGESAVYAAGGVRYVITPQTDGVKVDVYLLSAPAFDAIRFLTSYTGFTYANGVVSDSSGGVYYYRAPWAQQDVGTRLRPEDAYIDDVVTEAANANGIQWTLDLSGDVTYPVRIDPSGSFQPSSGSWDCVRNGAYFNRTTSTLYLGSYDDPGYEIGCLFDAVSVPQAATINAAGVTMTNTVWDDSDGSTLPTNVFAEAADNPSTIVSASDFAARTRTTAYDLTNIDSEWAAGTELTFDATTAVQEVINRTGWVTGNRLLLFFTPVAGGSHAWTQPAAYETGTYDPPTLDIDYTESGGGGGFGGGAVICTTT